MPKVETLADLVFEDVKNHITLPVPEPMARKAVRTLVDGLVAGGWQLIPPGSTYTPKLREDVKIDDTSFFCPHCGKHKPAYGLNMQQAMLPGFGHIAYMTVFYECCRNVLQVTIVGAQPDAPGKPAVQ